MNKFFKKFVAVLLINGIMFSVVFGFSPTYAYFNDTEESVGNIFSAGSLDFYLLADDWTLEDGEEFTRGSVMNRNVEVVSSGSLDFQYDVRSEYASGSLDFCNVLQFEAEHDAVMEFNGNLMDFELASPSFDINTVNDWNFSLSLPASVSTTFESNVCEFDFVFDGWQLNTSKGFGFNDTERLANRVEAAELFTRDVSPIADAFVQESEGGANYGAEIELSVRSSSSDDARSFIKFDFNLPSGSIVHYSELKLFMNSAPNSNRSYITRRITADWNEDNVTWNNQPTVDESLITDITSTGTVSQSWTDWDVTYDIQNFVLGTPNYGWRISDLTESWTPMNEAFFNSREGSDHTPVLEISFTPIVVTTPYVVINEVYSDVAGDKGVEIDNEWVELYNPTGSSVDISGWEICDGNSCDVIPSSPSIPAKGFAVISPIASSWNEYWPEIIDRGAVTIELGSSIGNGLANSGESVILKDLSASVIDAMSYGSDDSQLNPAIPESNNGKSLARVVKGYDTDQASDWIINATPNPGTNPSNSGMEIFRITSEGVEVADFDDGLDPLDDEEGADDEPALKQEDNVDKKEIPLVDDEEDNLIDDEDEPTDDEEEPVESDEEQVDDEIEEELPNEDTEEDEIIEEVVEESGSEEPVDEETDETENNTEEDEIVEDEETEELNTDDEINLDVEEDVNEEDEIQEPVAEDIEIDEEEEVLDKEDGVVLNKEEEEINNDDEQDEE